METAASLIITLLKTENITGFFQEACNVLKHNIELELVGTQFNDTVDSE